MISKKSLSMIQYSLNRNNKNSTNLLLNSITFSYRISIVTINPILNIKNKFIIMIITQSVRSTELIKSSLLASLSGLDA